VTCEVTAFNAVQAALEAAGIKPDTAEIQQVPKAMAEVDVETGKKVARMLDLLDEHDDVQNVYSNANLTAEMVADE
jgi:transcriptional/translational regulatory protein YebC/TACO1